MNRQERIRRALEDIELLKLCQSIINKEDLYPIRTEVEKIFAEAQNKRGYVPGFYRIQNEYNGYANEEELWRQQEIY